MGITDGHRAWTDAEHAYLADHPHDWAGFDRRFPGRTRNAWRSRRSDLHRGKAGRGRVHAAPTPPEGEPTAWDKNEPDFHWSDVLGAAESMQEVVRRSKGSQDHGTIEVKTDRPLPVLFVSDWHVGSWGISYRRLAEMTQVIKDLGLRVAILGDMIQLSIKLRNVLEISDNLLPPRLQMQFLRSWLEEMAGHILWATWDNHAVMREEQAVGFSTYAELFKEKTIYHSGIGHIDLTVGAETYRIASSHRFRGNSIHNPTHGQGRYLRMEGIDREVAVAGDSHRPAMATYFDGPLQRFAVNCGTLQTDSGYAKRHFSLSTHDSMPLLLFFPDRHKIVPFMNLDDYLAVTGRSVVVAPRPSDAS